MLGSSIGIEREQRFMDEIDKFPYIYDINIAEKVEQIQEEKQKDKLTNVTNEDEMIEELDNIILQKFNLENNEFIDYALNIQIPLINSRKNMMTRTVTPEEMEKYASYFQTYFKHIFNKSNKYIKIVLYPRVKEIYSIFELIISDNKNDEIIEIKNRFDKNINDFERIKNKINFEEDSFFIIKTRELKNWNLEAAKLDLEKVISEIVSDEAGGEDE